MRPWELAPFLFGRRLRVRVSGGSMWPTLRPGDEVLVRPGLRGLAPGRLVLARHPYKGDVRMIKRVHAVLPDGRLDLRGDHPLESEDSRGFGPVPPSLVLGVVVSRFPRCSPPASS